MCINAFLNSLLGAGDQQPSTQTVQYSSQSLDHGEVEVGKPPGLHRLGFRVWVRSRGSDPKALGHGQANHLQALTVQLLKYTIRTTDTSM